MEIFAKLKKTSNQLAGSLQNLIHYSSRGAFEFVILAILFITADPNRHGLFLGLTVSVVGEIVRIWAAGYKNRVKGFFIAGPYRFVRHPYYLGTFLFMLGLVIAGRQAWLLAGYLVGVAVTFRHAIRYEEQVLSELAGPLFSRYCDQVSAFVPQLIPVAAQPNGKSFSLAYGVLRRKRREIDGIMGLIFAFCLLWLCTILPEKRVFHVSMAVGVCLFFAVRFFRYRR